jgi:hypothetical protein
MGQEFAVNKKRLVVRIVLLALVILLGFVLFYIGKEHEVLIDNKTVTIEGKEYEAADYIVITVNGDEDNAVELYEGERDAVRVAGMKHTFKVEVIDEDTDEVLKSQERAFNFGRISALMISAPALADNAPNVFLPHPSTVSD